MALPDFPAGSSALAKTHLTPDIFARLTDKSTDTGFTLSQAIASGLVHKDSSIGIYAGDGQSYQTFAPLFDPIIREYHNLETRVRHCEDYTLPALTNPDPEGRYILSSRIRVARNLASIPFTPNMDLADRLKVLDLAREACSGLPRPLAGAFFCYTDLDRAALDRKIKQKLAFPRGDRFQEAAGINRDFPAGRGIFLSQDNGFRVWVNEEDHFRIMAQQAGPDLAEVFCRLASGLDHLSRVLAFSRDSDLGYLNACPTNIGTAMRAGVHIRLPALNRHPEKLKKTAASHHLQIRGTMGEKTAVENAVFDISNARRLGVSAGQTIATLYHGLAAIIALEKKLT